MLHKDRLMRSFLVDGFVAGRWGIDGRTLVIKPIVPLTDKVRAKWSRRVSVCSASLRLTATAGVHRR